MPTESEKEKHLRLLANAFFDNLEIDGSEYGGIGLDSKRPFGNSDVEGDMLEILDIEVDDGNDDDDLRVYVSDLYHNDLIPYLKKKWRCDAII